MDIAWSESLHCTSNGFILHGDGFALGKAELPKGGLSSNDVNELRNIYGFNEVPRVKKSYLVMFLRKFWGLSPVILELAIIASFALQNWVLGGVTFALLLLNAIIGVWQEIKADRAITRLEASLRIDAKVLRDGEWAVVPSRELVPGDVIALRQGDMVPADVVIVGDLLVDQSALTGESDAIAKSAGADVFSGSVVRQGECEAVVKVTGPKSRFADCLKLVAISKPRMHVERLLFRIIVIQMTVALALLLVAIIVLLANPSTRGTFVPNIPLFLSIIVAAVPVALPAMFTLTMALGSVELNNHGMLITRLSATEDAASMTVLCSDKTGTLTQNKLSVVDVIPFEQGLNKSDVLHFALWACNAASMDAIDSAVIDATKRSSHAELEKISGFETLEFEPFTARTRKTEATVRVQGMLFRASKGAVATIVHDCGIEQDSDAGLWVAQKMESASKIGYRVLAVAGASTDEMNGLLGPMQFKGLLCMADPLRESSVRVVEELGRMGVSVKMISGDNTAVAKNVASQLELHGEIVRFSDVDKSTISLVKEVAGYAEVFPEDKHLIVSMLQSQGHIVGMTGDGVNDAPALKQAEVGIAVSNATDVAKAAASVLSFEEGLVGVPHMVAVGRQIHSRLRTWILNKITKTVQQGFIVLLFLIRQVWVVNAINLIVLLFLIDFATLIIATDTARIAMRPLHWQISRLLIISLTMGVLCLAQSLGIFYLFLYVFNYSSNIGLQNSLSFLILFSYALFNTFSLRERRHFWSSRPSWWMIGMATIDLTVALIMCCVGADVFALPKMVWWHTFIVVGWCLGFILIVNDFIKVFLHKLMRIDY